MARWKSRRKLSDEELLTGYRWWEDQKPPWDAPRDVSAAWVAELRSWADERGVSVLDLIRMSRVEKEANH